MPYKKILILTALMVFFGAGASSNLARADFLIGKQLRLFCLSENPADEVVCIVYITGAVDAITTLDLIAEKTQGTKRRFCIPENVSPDDLREVTLEWLERPQSNLDFAATLLVLGAIEDKYACP